MAIRGTVPWRTALRCVVAVLGICLAMRAAQAQPCESSDECIVAGSASYCAGDCNNNGSVTVDEILKGINVALGNSLIGDCLAFDLDASSTITVDELITGVNAALAGCPANVFEVTIDKPMVFLTGAGQSATLTARIVDAQGTAMNAPVTWTSSNPNQVTIDAAGGVAARGIGSAQIFAEAAGVRSAPTLIIVAEPQPGALLVSDAQVVSVGPPLHLASGESPGVGTEYEVTLQGVAAPAPGTVVLAAESAPVAGRVVATRVDAGGLVVTLALAPLYELFSAYDIALTIDLSAFPSEAVPAQSALPTQSAVWNAERRGNLRTLTAAQQPAESEPFRTLHCDTSLEPKLGEPPIQLSPEANLKLVLEDRPGYSKHALEGSVTLVGSVGIKLEAGFEASGRCDAQRQYIIRAGWVGVIVAPAVYYGFGVALTSEILLVQAELGATGTVGLSIVAGWECGGATPACRALDNITSVNNFKTKSKIPSENDMQAKVSAHFYALAGLRVGVGKILEGRIGPKQSFDLAFEEDQAARTDYASSYDLKLEGVIEPGAALKKAIAKVIGDDSTAVKFKGTVSDDLSESPKGSLSVSKAKVRPGESVDFTVDLTPNTVVYKLLGYNVVGVELYRKREDESKFTFWKFMDLNSTYRAMHRWTPVAADAGKYEFAAFVETQIPVPKLEVAPNSIQPVEVSCFGASGLSANGMASGLQASTCADVWHGSAESTYTVPGGGYKITGEGLTWTPVLSDAVRTIYKLTAGTVTYEYRETGCTTSVDPPSVTYDETSHTAASELEITWGDDPVMFSGSAAIAWAATVTIDCPGEDTLSYPTFVGNQFFRAERTVLTGDVRADNYNLMGAWDFVYSFQR